MASEPQSSDGPDLPLSEWADTCATLHRWTQAVGKIRLAHAPMVNHWWPVPVTGMVADLGLDGGSRPNLGRRLAVRVAMLAGAAVGGCRRLSAAVGGRRRLSAAIGGCLVLRASVAAALGLTAALLLLTGVAAYPVSAASAAWNAPIWGAEAPRPAGHTGPDVSLRADNAA